VPTPSSLIQIALEETPRYLGAPSSTPYRIATDVAYLPITSTTHNPNPSFVDRADEIRGIEGAVPQLIDAYAPAGDFALRAYANPLTWLLTCAGFTATRTAGASGGTSEVQTVTITGAPTGGTFTLTFTRPGTSITDTTTAIAYNASNAAVQAALEALPGIGTGNAVVAGGPLPGTAVTVTFANRLGSRDIAVMTAAGSFTGGTSPAIAVTTTTPGVAGSVADPDGGTVPTGASKWVFSKRSFTTSTQQARSMQMIMAYVTEGQFATHQGVGVNSLTMNAAGEVTGGTTGLYSTYSTTDPNLTPAYDTQAIPFFRRGDITLTWLANTSTTDDFSWTVTNDLSPNRPLGQASSWPGELNPGDARVRVTGSMPKYRFGAADMTALLNGVTFGAKARWQTPTNIGATTYPYGMWLEMPACQYTGGGPSALANTRRIGASFDWTAGWDEGSGYDVRITLVNSVTSIGAPFNASNAAV
jgi:hypothetical protein